MFQARSTETACGDATPGATCSCWPPALASVGFQSRWRTTFEELTMLTDHDWSGPELRECSFVMIFTWIITSHHGSADATFVADLLMVCRPYKSRTLLLMVISTVSAVPERGCRLGVSAFDQLSDLAFR